VESLHLPAGPLHADEHGPDPAGALPARARLGAAFYVLYDKADSKAGDLRGEFRSFYQTMMNEHMRHSGSGQELRPGSTSGSVRCAVSPGQWPAADGKRLIIAPDAVPRFIAEIVAGLGTLISDNNRRGVATSTW